MSKVKKEVTKEYIYPSRFGSHSSMKIGEVQVLNNDDQYVAVHKMQDEHGEYFTTKQWIDNGKADPNRCFGREFKD